MYKQGAAEVGAPEPLLCSSVSWVSTEATCVQRGDVRDLGPLLTWVQVWLFLLFRVAMGHSLLTSLILEFSLQKLETSLLHRLLGELNKNVWKAPSIVLMHPDCSTNQILSCPPSLQMSIPFCPPATQFSHVSFLRSRR